MNEPTQPPAQAPGQASPPPTPPQQAPQNTPPTQPPAASTPPATPPPVPPAAPNNPPPAAQPPPVLTAQQIQQIQQQNAEAQRKITEQGQQLAQLKQQRDALAGVQAPQPQADPIAPIIAKLVAKGMHPDDAKIMADGIHAATEPYRHQLQQQQQSIQATSMVGDVMREAWNEMPQLFAANPQVGQRVEQMLRQNAVTGAGPVDKQFAIALAKIEWADAHFAAQAGGQQAPPPQQPPSFQSMYAPQPGFTAPAPAAPVKTLTPAQLQAQAEIRAEFFPKPATA